MVSAPDCVTGVRSQQTLGRINISDHLLQLHSPYEETGQRGEGCCPRLCFEPGVGLDLETSSPLPSLFLPF